MKPDSVSRGRWLDPLDFCIYLALEAAVLAVYGQVHGFDFVTFDDCIYVDLNPHVQQGLTLGGIGWAFTTGHIANWHPITWLSHMVDVALFGQDPGFHHFVNVGFHLANSLLLFWLLKRMTGARWRSALAAALFAVHPLNVESVAWISERKNVLSTLFWLLTTAAYTDYVNRRKAAPYGVMVLWFMLGLMAKPMLVTLPATLLLLDIWPLSRYDGTQPTLRRAAGLVVEKMPLFALSVVSAVITFVVQNRSHALVPLDAIPVYSRLENALVSYGRYLGMMICPHGLAPFYPHPGPIVPLWYVVSAGAVLTAICIAVASGTRRHPYLIVGWLWYLVTLIPVIGVVQTGAQALADRYMYVPSIGLFVIAAWGGADLASRLPRLKPAVAATTGAAVLALALCAAVQTTYWRGGIPLWTHAMAVTSNNYMAHRGLGAAFANEKQYPEAIAQYREGLRIHPCDADLHALIGGALVKMDKTDEARVEFRRALAIKPKHAGAHRGLAKLLAEADRLDEAIAHYATALEADPDNAYGHLAMGDALAAAGRSAEAIPHYREVLRLYPWNDETCVKLADLLAKQGEHDDAVKYYREAIHINPDNADARLGLGDALASEDP